MAAAALQVFKVSVQLIKMSVIDPALIIYAVVYIIMILYMISYVSPVDGLNTVIYLFQQVLTVSGAISKSKKAVIFFQMILVGQQVIQCLQPFATETVVIDVDIHP
jgi:hypothetical protein